MGVEAGEGGEGVEVLPRLRNGAGEIVGFSFNFSGVPMRELTSHVVNPVNDQLTITVMDEPGSGGANHRYDITGFDTENNPSASAGSFGKCSFSRTILLFQNGPFNEVGVNGITHEALLAVLIDRLQGFQRGPYRSADNQIALDYLSAARGALHKRTRERMQRGVEGTHTV